MSSDAAARALSSGMAEKLDDVLWIVVLGFVACFVMAMAMGANDVANAFGTSVGSGVLTMRQAFVIASVCNMLGAVSMGGAVTQTIRNGIVDLQEFSDSDDPQGLMLLMLCAMAGSITYVAAATRLGLPVSTTQSILGGLVGAMIARDRGKPSGVQWIDGRVCKYSKETGRASCGGVVGIVLQWIFAPLLAMFIATMLFVFTRAVLLRAPLEVAERRAAPLMSFFFGGVAFALCWFIVVQESHHPHSRGWHPRNANDNPNNATALEVVVCVLVAVGAAYLALVLFSLYPNALRYIPASTGEERGTIQLTTTDPAKDEESTTSNPMSLEEDAGGDDGDALGAPCQQLGAGEQYGSRLESLFGSAQISTASLAAFAAGANDVANEVAPLAAIWQTYHQGEVTDKVKTPRWLFVYAGAGIAVGLVLFGRRVMKTIGKDTTELTPSRGFHIELGYSLASLIASAEGWPVSTTQLAVGALVGVGLVSGEDVSTAVNCKLLRKIFCAWVLTPILTALFAMVYFASLRPAL